MKLAMQDCSQYTIFLVAVIVVVVYAQYQWNDLPLVTVYYTCNEKQTDISFLGKICFSNRYFQRGIASGREKFSYRMLVVQSWTCQVRRYPIGMCSLKPLRVAFVNKDMESATVYPGYGHCIAIPLRAVEVYPRILCCYDVVCGKGISNGSISMKFWVRLKLSSLVFNLFVCFDQFGQRYKQSLVISL